MKQIYLTIAIAFAYSIFSTSTVCAQVNGSGISDSSLFDNVINIPTDPDIGDSTIGTPDVFFIGGVDGETIQLNLLDNGNIGDSFNTRSGSELNISGGSVGSRLVTQGEFNISGGNIGSNFFASSPSETEIAEGTISGGTFGFGFSASSFTDLSITGGIFSNSTDIGGTANISGGNFGQIRFGNDIKITGGGFGYISSNVNTILELVGGDFKLNNNAFSGSSITFDQGDVFTGVLQDGSAFVLNNISPYGDSLPNSITLTSVTLPELTTTPIVVDGTSSLANLPTGVGPAQTVTIEDGGEIVNNFDAVDGTLNVEGGVIKKASAVRSTVNVSGGNIGFDGSSGGRGIFEALFSEINISGGTTASFRPSDSTVNISGGTTQLFSSSNNVVNIEGGDVFIEPVPVLIDTEFNLSGGRIVRSFTPGAGNVVNMSGGLIGENSGAREGAVVNIGGGTVDRSFSASFGSEVNISGGDIGHSFIGRGGSNVSISGGSIGEFFKAERDSNINISGGTFGDNFQADFGSNVIINGGTFGVNFEAQDGSDVQLIGGEFKYNGSAFNGASVSLGLGDVLSGTFEDGSSFIFTNVNSGSRDDRLSNVTLTNAPLPTIDLTPIFVDSPLSYRPSGLRKGQELTLQTNGDLGNSFEVVDATLNIQGGTIGAGAGSVGSTVNISGGNVGRYFSAGVGSVVNMSDGFVGWNFDANSGSEVNISGGSVDSQFAANPGSTVNISGGSVGTNFDANTGSTVNISGGTVDIGFTTYSDSVVSISGGSVGDLITVLGGSELNISGGSIGDRFYAISDSEVNLFGSDFVLDGMPLDDGLAINEAFTIVDRDVTLSGLLADGSAFSFYLNSDRRSNGDFFSSDATLTVTLVFPLGDCNQDGTVDFLDIASFVAVLASGDFLEQADCNQDGVLNFLDISAFIAILVGN